MFQESLGIQTVLMGFALPDSAHGRNEKFHLPVYCRAIPTSITFLHEMARRSFQIGAAQMRGDVAGSRAGFFDSAPPRRLSSAELRLE